jgi:hypothetical protein
LLSYDKDIKTIATGALVEKTAQSLDRVLLPTRLAPLRGIRAGESSR